jgi:hypothetical protein
MNGDAPRLALALPAGWSDDVAGVPPPDLAQSPQLSVTRWDALAHGEAHLVVGCFRADVGGWVDEADALAQDKLASVATSTALRAGVGASFRSEARGREGDVRVERLRGDAEGGPAPLARTWLGFADGRAHACFALCGGTGPARAGCDEAVEHAHLEGTQAAPPPTLGLRALVAVVHHPEAAATALAAVLVAGGLLAIATRRRPPRRARRVSRTGAVSRTLP